MKNSPTPHGQIASIEIPPAFRVTDDIQDDVFEPLRLSQIEIDLVGTPEFQRLFRVSQMGFVDLVYPSANHTRGVHSMGCCSWAKKLVAILNENAEESSKEWVHLKLSLCETALISIGALLHDLSHGPYAHDIEKKSHLIYPFEQTYPEKLSFTTKIKSGYGPYEKHDDYVNNPVLYITLLNPQLSVIARVLRRHSPDFWKLMKAESDMYPQLQEFVAVLKRYEQNGTWPELENELLPQLVFHLFAFEKFEDAKTRHQITLAKTFNSKELSDWGLGPDETCSKALHDAWYQPYRHDIIGDTLSADLLDYLHRDLSRLGFDRALDLKLLKSYLIIPVPDDDQIRFKDSQGEPLFDRVWYRCALDLEDAKRGNVRMERLNDLFRLLDLRHEIHEKAVFHRIVQSGIAMLSRAILRLPVEEKPTLQSMYGFESGASPAMCGDDHFLELLIEGAKKQPEYCQSKELINQSLTQKLAERRMYRPLMTIPGDRVTKLLENVGGIENNPAGQEKTLRELAAIVDSEHFKPFFCFISKCIDELLQHLCDDVDRIVEEAIGGVDTLQQMIKARPPKHVIFWVLPYKQLYKDPEIVARVGNHVATIEALRTKNGVNEFVKERIRAGLEETQSKYTTLWKLYIFLSDGLFYTGPAALLLDGACTDETNAGSRHSQHLKEAQILVIRALRAAWQYWVSQVARLRESTEGSKEIANLLHKSPSEQCLKEMLIDLQRQDKTDDFNRIWRTVVTGSVDAYIHARDDGGQITDGCRDIRYKYDASLSGTFADRLAAFGLTRKKRPLIQRILEASDRQPSSFGNEEFNYLVNRLAAAPQKRLKACFEVRNMDIAARGEQNQIDKRMLQEVLRDPKGDNGWESAFSPDH
jgi:HD superfamily phosphohydrolase